MSTLNVDVKLGVNKFRVDEENPHIVLVDSPDPKEFDKLILACPANLYKRDADGTVRFDYAGCLECVVWQNHFAKMGVPSGYVRHRISFRLVSKRRLQRPRGCCSGAIFA